MSMTSLFSREMRHALTAPYTPLGVETNLTPTLPAFILPVFILPVIALLPLDLQGGFFLWTLLNIAFLLPKRGSLSPSGTRVRWLIALYLGIALGYLGLLAKAAADGLLWRADFTAFYTGGAIVRQGWGSRLYDLELQSRVQQALLGPGRMFYDGVLPFNNPPHFALVMVPFTFLPLGTAFGVWAVLQLGLLTWVLCRIWELTASWSHPERWVLLSAFLAFFPLLLHFLHGSLSLFVFLGLMEFYRALKRGKDVRAGAWLALAAVKPQAALFPALVLLAARRWRALVGAGAAGLVILGVTSAILGSAIWLNYLRWLVATSGYFDRFGVYPRVMYNLKGTLTLWLGIERAPLIQAVSMGALAVGVAMTLARWARARWTPWEPEFDLRLAFTLTLGALLSPHQNPHDSLTLLLPVVLFYDFLRRTGRPIRAAAVFLLSWPVLFLLEEFVLRGTLGLRLPVLLMAILLVWIAVLDQRLRKGNADDGSSRPPHLSLAAAAPNENDPTSFVWISSRPSGPA